MQLNRLSTVFGCKFVIPEFSWILTLSCHTRRLMLVEAMFHNQVPALPYIDFFTNIICWNKNCCIVRVLFNIYFIKWNEKINETKLFLNIWNTFDTRRWHAWRCPFGRRVKFRLTFRPSVCRRCQAVCERQSEKQKQN